MNPTKPLYKKLGLKSDKRLIFLNAPDNIHELYGQYPTGIEIIKAKTGVQVDFVHLFVLNLKELESLYSKAKSYLRKDSMLWVSWPKKSSGIQTDINRDIIREYILANGLVDVKVASINEQWSGLKFVYRLIDR